MASFSALLLRRILVMSAVGLNPFSAMAQTGSNVIPQTVTGLDANGGQQLKPVGTGASGTFSAPMPVTGSSSGTPIPTAPPRLTAYGTLAVSSPSVALSTLTPGPNSPAWSTTYPNGYVSIRNSVNSTDVAYFCPLGGTCSATVGEPIGIGETIFRNIANAVSPTLFSTAGATVTGEE